MSVKRIFSEPLLHFIVVGCVLFGIYNMLPHARSDRPLSDKTIVVNNKSLLNFLQYRSKAFQSEYFTSQLEGMSPAERQRLEDQYVEEELLYREAMTLGLDQGDYVIRQRLVQKMRFLIDDIGDMEGPPPDDVLDAYVKQHKELYAIAPSVTFTHVFIDSSIHGENSKAIAQRLSLDLNLRSAAFNDAPKHGERFPFLQNYVERTLDYISSHFGPDFAETVKNLAPSERWSEPIQSAYGYHLVLLTDRTEDRLPDLQEIRAQVQDDWLRDRIEALRSQSLKSMAAQYKIERQDSNIETSK
jgi:hypothetical protein